MRLRSSEPNKRHLIDPQPQTKEQYRYPGSEEVRRYALPVADGVCQECENLAPFIATDGEPYLKFHHIEPWSGGATNALKNVIAICVNCHQRVYNGQDGVEVNAKLERRAEEHYEQFMSS